MNRRRLAPPPTTLTRAGVRLDNLAIVPASLLPRRAEYQQLANTLPRGQVLIVMPGEGRPRERLKRLVDHLRQRGRRVTTRTLAPHHHTPRR